MVRITNGIDEFVVTRGAFDGIYSHQGYRIIPDNPSQDISHDDAANVGELTEDEQFVNELIEKPISQWKKEELKQFAAIKEIDLSGTKSINEAKAIVKEFMETEQEV